MTSVARKIHMPKLEASRCCSSLAKWWSSAGLWMSSCEEVGTAAWLSDNLGLLLLTGVDLVVVVGFPSHDRLLIKIECGRRRRSLPLKSRGLPGIIGRGLAVAHRPEEVNHGQKIADGEHRGSGGRE